MSTNGRKGSFELLVKCYEGGLSEHMSKLEPGQSLEFKHIPFNVKTQYPFGRDRIGMLAGGTGITPMIQALHAILGTEGDQTAVDLLYGSRTEQDILALELLESWAEQYSGRLTVTHVLSHEPTDSDWAGRRGFIDRGLLEARMPAPGAGGQLWVCGPPGMYEALCGPRGDEQLSGLLAEMGYAADEVYKF